MHEDDVPQDVIDAWAAEAEVGYDVDHLERRGRGRPGRGAEPRQVVALRPTAHDIAVPSAPQAETGPADGG